jgi:hypothetical protein
LLALLRKAFFVNIRVFELTVIMTLITSKNNSLSRGTLVLGLFIVQLITFSRKAGRVEWMTFLKSARSVLRKLGFGESEIRRLIEISNSVLEEKEAFLSSEFELKKFEGILVSKPSEPNRGRRVKRPRTPSAVGTKSSSGTRKLEPIPTEDNSPDRIWEEIHLDSLTPMSLLDWESLGSQKDEISLSKPTDDELAAWFETFQRILSKEDKLDAKRKERTKTSL